MVSRGKVGNSQHFPTNLHILLDEAEKANHAHVVSWCAQGHSFKIHDQDALVPLLAKYFRQTKFKSFLRQLQSYGFHRTTRGCDKGTVSHPFFVRGRRSLCFRMTRKPSGASSQALAALPSRFPRHGSSPGTLGLGGALPANGILPIRKTNSAPPLFQNSQSRAGGMQFADLSQLKNEAFEYNNQGNRDLEEMGSNYLQALKVQSYNPPKRRSSTTSILYSRNSFGEHQHQQQKVRRASDPVVTMTAEQRNSLLKCAEIDYRESPSVETTSPRLSPRKGFLLSIEESTSATPNQVPSQPQQHHQQQQQQQQQYFQDPIPLQQAMHQQPQDQSHQQVQQVIQVQQRIPGPQNQVHIQQVQYQQPQPQEQPPQAQVHVRYLSEQKYPEQVEFTTQYRTEQPQDQPEAKAGKVFTQQEVEEQIKKAKEDMATNFREQLKLLGAQNQFRQQEHQQLPQQMNFHGMQTNQQVVQQLPQQQPVECEKPQKEFLPMAQVQYHHMEPQKGVFAQSVSVAHPQKTASALYAQVPSNNFELSFSTSEFTNGEMAKANNARTALPSYAPSSEVANGPSFSLAISTPKSLPSGLAADPMPPTPTNVFNRTTAAIQPINIQSIQSNHHTLERQEPASFSQQQQQQPVPSCAPQCCSSTAACSSTEATVCESIDEGTVDFLLQNGSGGCDEWEMPAEEVAEGLNYYGFLNNEAPQQPAPEQPLSMRQ